MQTLLACGCKAYDQLTRKKVKSYFYISVTQINVLLWQHGIQISGVVLKITEKNMVQGYLFIFVLVAYSSFIYVSV